MNGELMLATACEVAKKIGARAVVSFIEPAPVMAEPPGIPIIRVQELPRCLKTSMHDILEVSQHHLLDAAVLYTSSATLVGNVRVFSYAIVIYDIEEEELHKPQDSPISSPVGPTPSSLWPSR